MNEKTPLLVVWHGNQVAPAERQKLLGLQPLTFTAGKAADVAAVANVLCGDKALCSVAPVIKASAHGRACTSVTS